MSLASVSPLTLISHTRLDILSRLPLAKMFIREETIDPWAIELYREFLRATTPSLKFSENGTKFSITDYMQEFRTLVGSLQINGFDSKISTIPLGKKGIQNGAHRVAAALALGLEVTTEDSEEQEQIYDWSYLKRIGLKDIYCDYLLYLYTMLKPSTLAFLLSDLEDSTIRRIERHLRDADIFVGSKSLTLSQIGARRLVTAAYEHNDWWQPKFSETMTLERFSSLSSTNKAHLIIIDLPINSRPRKIKEHLRSLLPGDSFERLIHGTDTHEETVTLAQFALNRNSLQFNNLSPIGSEKRILSELKVSGREWMKDVAIDGSSVLEVFGIRQANDLDYVALDAKVTADKGLDLHNLEYRNYPFSYDPVLLDPRLHFYISGFKFASLGTVIHQKSFNVNEKNINDLLLISQMLKSDKATYVTGERPVNVAFWKFQTGTARILEPVITRMPTGAQIFTRKLLKNIRIIAEKIFRY